MFTYQERGSNEMAHAVAVMHWERRLLKEPKIALHRSWPEWFAHDPAWNFNDAKDPANAEAGPHGASP